MVTRILNGNSHPCFDGMFEVNYEGKLTSNTVTRTAADKKYFSVVACEIFNKETLAQKTQ